MQLLDAASYYTFGNDNVYDKFIYMFNEMPTQLYDNMGRCAYILLTGGAAECRFIPETNIDHIIGSFLTISRIQSILINGNYGVDLLYIQSNNDQRISGYYQMQINNQVKSCHIVHSAVPHMVIYKYYGL